MIRTSILFVLLLAPVLLPACKSNGDSEENTRTAENGEIRPLRNLLTENERSQLYWDLDQNTQLFIQAWDDGKVRAANGIKTGVVRPLVDKNLDELIATIHAREEPIYEVIASRALGFCGHPEKVVPTLVENLDHENAAVINSSLVSLYLLAWPETPLAPMIRLLNHGDDDIRANDTLAIYAVLKARRIGGIVPMDAEVRDLLGRLLVTVSDPRDPFVRGNAAAILGVIGHAGSTDVLINLLDDESSAVRTRAAEALGQLRQEAAIAPLIGALRMSMSPGETRLIIAALDSIARDLGYPCDKEALGPDHKRWDSWYRAVKGDTGG